MYREFFGLKLKPFSITPDPRFLYMSPGHKEALAHLLYGLKEASGFVVITGEVGTGKTTILNAFLLKLPPRMPKVVVKNPHIKPENLYFLLGEAIGLAEEKRTRDHLSAFEERLKEMGGAVLIIDESQGLSVDMLEEVRLLSNMETTHEKLVQIMLLGQQELNEKLKSPNLRQLKQRIGIKYHIPPLDSNETRDYIDHRLRVAGYEPMEKPLFTVSALTEIYRYSKGYPRLVNIVCDNVLIAAYTDGIKQISASLVRKAVSDLESTYSTKKGLKTNSHQPGNGMITLWAKRAAVLALLVLAAAGLIRFIYSEKEAVPPARHVLSMPGATQTPVVTEAGPSEDPGPAGTSPDGALVPQNPEEKDVREDVKPVGAIPLPGSDVSPTRRESKEFRGKVVTVSAGDTVAKLAADYYGRIDSGILQAVRKANPDTPNLDLIHRGQRISLPQLNLVSQVLFSVSVASFPALDEARALFNDLVGKGHQATIYPYADTRGAVWYRVTVGTFTGRQEAIDFAKQLKSKGFETAKPVKISMEE